MANNKNTVAQSDSLRTNTDPMLEGTGQPGELFGTPDEPSQMLLDDMQEEETGVPQDPALKGTGQPGELYGVPEKISKHDKAKREASKAIASSFGGKFWLNSISPDLEIKPFSPSIVAKKMNEEA
tara:strand:+ start:531 stop:905 length:375 start_codon:yes stop_codon:yes gene_type:complete